MMERRLKAPEHRPCRIANKIVEPRLARNSRPRRRNCALQPELEFEKAWRFLLDVLINGWMKQYSCQLIEM